ncbi:hypothetical protein [Actinophytocola sp. NPDC049390]|uniref:hypothetical protein n=1 Tax=Actinophytocola sp. NPDC049390 TaxID=3363894 RepID=UPI00379CA9EA
MLQGIARRLFGTRGRVRDSASFGAASLGVLLIAGAVLGTGVARTAVDVSDGLTWLPDDPRGEVVQVNPASGRPEVRLRVAGGDARLEITQKDGVLVVLDRRTGQITVIDLATLLASGRRQVPPGTASKVLVSQGRVYVVDRVAGTITNADPVTLADVGGPWRAGQPLADVVVDEAGVVWAVDHDGHLHALEWSDDDRAFREKSDETVRGAGPATVLVPHSTGVTLFGLDDGVVVQVGTGQDVSGATPRLPGEVLAAQNSPSGLVPAAVPDRGAVVLVSGERVVRVDAAALGCGRPGRPVVFRDRVYVPCLGSGKVIVLDRGGERGAKDIPTPGGGDPQLVFDDGRLFISGPGAERGVIVDADGSTKPVTIRSPELPVVNPDRPPIPEVPTPPRPSPRPEEPTRPGSGRGDQPRPPDTPGPGTTTGPSRPGGGTGGAPGAPPGVTVMLAERTGTELTATVSWGTPADNGSAVTSYTVVASGDFTGGSQSTRTTETTVRLTFPCAGTTFCDNGSLDVAVTATNRAGRGATGTAAWTVPPPQQQPTTTTTRPPVPTTTTNPPAPPTTTTQPPTTTTTPPPPPPPPPPSLPSAGASVIGTVLSGGRQDYTRTMALNPPSDWATHNGRCELVNTTHGYAVTIACSATSAEIAVEQGGNRLVVRAHASDGRSVDSAPKSVPGPREPMCGKYLCFGTGKIVELSPVERPIRFGQAGAGLGLLVIAVFLYARRND